MTAYIHPPSASNRTEYKTDVEGANTLKIDNLKSGTKYAVQIYYSVNNIISAESYNLTEYTKPESVDQEEVNITEITEHSITVQINPRSNKNCDKYQIWIASNSNSVQEIFRNDTSHDTATFQNLTGGVLYTLVFIATAGKHNSNATMISNYTRPPRIIKASVSERYNSSLTLSMEYRDKEQTLVRYRIYISQKIDEKAKINQYKNPEDRCCNIQTNGNGTVLCTSNNTYTIANLKAGTLYNLIIYSCIDGLQSETPYQLTEYTKPETPVVNFISWEETSLTVNWTVKDINTREQIVLDIKPRPETGDSLLPHIRDKNDTSGTTAFENLKAGTMYKVTGYTILKIIDADRNQTLLSEGNYTVSHYTRPVPPPKNKIQVANIQTQSFEVSIQDEQWDKYRFEISPPPQHGNASVEVYHSKLPVRINNLKTGTMYTIKVYSFVEDIRSERNTTMYTYTSKFQES
ncbi:uncharacterized protein LOC128553053 [Mercenaria mercenaria]|uniref:uncharacterized protein LOC128553053 n=1 Tax=Mercenaria mercenaria TaxID=6596 RepID=UPI00234E5DA6|nr:uncharacterized protein LOC128553053 [Mercenaria mercenaria]